MRYAIVGGPRTGKTTLANLMEQRLSIFARHTDDLIPLGWSQASEAAASWFNEDGGWIIEGVTVPRALRRWLAAHPAQELPIKVIVLRYPKVQTTPRQKAMAKGVYTVWNEIKSQILNRGAEVTYEAQ